jgi:anti-anti-sigma regulatory factor
MFRIHSRTCGAITILDLSGSLAVGGPDALLREEVARLGSTGRRILLNLAHVGCRDAAALNALLGAHKAARDVNAELGLLHVTEGVPNLAIALALHTHFDVYDSETGALASAWGRSEGEQAA